MTIREFEVWELERNVRRDALLTRLDADQVADQVASAWGFTRDELLGPKRTAMHAEARAQLYGRLRDGGWSYPMIGSFAHRHHTTVMYALDAGNTAKRKRP